jgi:hypothetical protein
MTNSDTLAIAHRLLALGFSVFPVPPPRPGAVKGKPGDGKVPSLAWRDYQARLPTPDEIDRSFAHEPMNVAVVTGAISGVVVIDADNREALRWCTSRLPYTPWQTRTSHGFHLWYRYPSRPVKNAVGLDTRDARLKIDVRGDGGYVIAPGSRHASGAIYQFAGDWSASRDRVPIFWLGWLRRPERPGTPPRRPLSSRTTGDVVLARARAYLAAIPRPEIGAGSDTATFTAACRLVRGFGFCADHAADLLWEWAGGRPGWTRDWIAAKVRHAERYGDEPFGGLR